MAKLTYRALLREMHVLRSISPAKVAGLYLHPVALQDVRKGLGESAGLYLARTQVQQQWLFMSIPVTLIEHFPWRGNRIALWEEFQVVSETWDPKTIAPGKARRVMLLPGEFPSTGFIFLLERENLETAMARVGGQDGLWGLSALEDKADRIYRLLKDSGALEVAALGWSDVIDLHLEYQGARGVDRLEAAEALKARVNELFNLVG
jgi:hypothetical protein